MAGEQLTHQQSESRPAGQPGPNTRGPRFRPAWFAGVDVPTLNQVRSEWTFYDTLGTAVAILCAFSGVSATLAISYVAQVEPLQLWWIWFLWTPGLVCIERLILQMPNSDSWLSAAGSFAWRFALSVLLAFLFAEPMVMRLHEPEIQAQLSHDTRETIKQEYHAIDDDFRPKVKAAHQKLRLTRQRKADLEAKLADDRKRQAVAEEFGLAGVAIAAAGHAQTHERRLNAAIERNQGWQPELRKRLANLATAKGEAKERAKQEIEEGIGFEARVAALAGVIDKWPSTNYAVWGIRLLLLFLDLTPLIATIAYMRRSGSKPYRERREAAWAWDSLPAMSAREAVRVEEQRIRDAARADIRVNQAQTAASAERRILETTGGNAPPPSGPHSPLSAMDLDEFIAGMDGVGPWEAQKADVPDVLRSRAMLGLGLLGGATAIALLLITSAGAAISGAWILVAGLALATALCVYTGGFREAPSWAIPPILATFIAGLILPVFVLVINL